MRTVIDNKDIAGLPEAYQEQEITLVPHLNAFIADNFLESLEKEKNTEITARLTEEISGQIEQCLTKMAEIVEIPLG